MSNRAPIVCVGTSLVDTVALVDRLPAEDERIEASQVIMAGGGNAATTAVAIARLGVDVDFCGVVGDDEAGRLALAQLSAEGVGTELVDVRSGTTTAQSVVLVVESTASRAIVTRPAAKPHLVPPGYQWVHVDKAGYERLRESGRVSSRVSLDDGNPVPDLDLSLIDLYVPTKRVLMERFGGPDPVMAARRAIQQGAETVVATDGAHGCLAVTLDSDVHTEALHITPFSTLGAGDVFHGALLAALVLGKKLRDALEFANATAALSCRSLDGRSGIPSRVEVEALLSEQSGSGGIRFESTR